MWIERASELDLKARDVLDLKGIGAAIRAFEIVDLGMGHAMEAEWLFAWSPASHNVRLQLIADRAR
jgi:hypothetical protein